MERMLLEATKEGMKLALDRLTDEMEKENCPVKQKNEFLIAFEELFVNIVHYAYGPQGGMVEVRFGFEERKDMRVLNVALSDRGKRYNPLVREDPKLEETADARQVGGLGIFMAKRLLDTIWYERRDGQNHLGFSKGWRGNG